LSKSTALNGSCKTIDKYLSRTDNLVILYAVEDVSCVGRFRNVPGVMFQDVKELFPNLSDGLVSEFESFIRRVNAKR